MTKMLFYFVWKVSLSYPTIISLVQWIKNSIIIDNNTHATFA